MAGDDARGAAPFHDIAFTLGSRRLLRVRRQLATLAFSLEDALAQRMPAGAEGPDGLRVLSAPLPLIGQLQSRWPGHLQGAMQRYPRSYIAMDGGFDAYLARFSGKTRSTLRRKQRKLEEAGGGALDLRAYRTAQEVGQFLDLAQPLAARTYQARLLDAGLPDGADWRAEALALAAQDRVRAFLLFVNDAPIAYLYLPIEGVTLVYAYLGYDPAHSALSPGTVLQMAALERLFAEGRFRYFDFTEGQGAHKALFGTDAVECASFLLLRPTLANRALLAGLAGFDGAVAGAKTLARKSGAEAALRRLLRS